MKTLRTTLAALMLSAVALVGGLLPGRLPPAPCRITWKTKNVDYVFRGQAYTAPTTVHVALATAAGNDTACGTESPAALMPGGRHVVPGQLGRHNPPGSTTASTGTSGTISNNAAITFPAPRPTGARWSNIASSTPARPGTSFPGRLTVEDHQQRRRRPSFAAGALTFQADN